MFDVDCPSTPDGNNPKPTPSRPPSLSRRIANRGTSRSKFTPRIRTSTSYDQIQRSRSSSYDNQRQALEPEEMVVPQVSRAPRSGPLPIGGRYHAAPPMNPGTPPSNNPFDDDRSFPARGRTHSDSWWKEEIVNEREDKREVMEGYYGLSQKDKQEFYGKSNNPFEENAINKHGHTSFQVHQGQDVSVGIGIDQDGNVESSLVDTAKQGNQYNARPGGNGYVARPIPQRPQRQAQYSNDMTNQSVYQQAASIRTGHHHLDDYSFSTINIHNIPKDASPRRSNSTNSSSMLSMPKWMESFAPSTSSAARTQPEYGIPSNITSETNLAPPIRGNHGDWWSSSPKVTFDTGYPEKRSRWSGLSHGQKVGVAVIWVALMCSLMGVTIWSLNRPPSGRDGDRSSLQGFMPANVGTGAPSFHPTGRPTKPPTSRSPVSGYSSLHGKGSTGTNRPTRSPITSRPSRSPITSPTDAPSEVPSSPMPSISTSPSVATELVQAVPFQAPCTDDQGYFLNHLMNPKDCAWLANDKEGYTDRKDKNCGTTIYAKTDLGSACRATCALYNGCVTEIPASPESTESSSYHAISFMSSLQVQSELSNSVQICTNGVGTFKNHLGSDKTCEWLHNEKPGQTERKDKNCGYADYPMTELGQNCPQTCIWYNKIGCSLVQMRSVEPQVRISSISSGCVNGSGKYENHHGDRKQCQWLHEPDRPNVEKFRRDKNCGTEEYPVTDLGMECSLSCKEYNGCDEEED